MQPPLSNGTEDCPGLEGSKLQLVVWGYHFQHAVKLKARKSQELELHFDFPCLEALRGLAEAGLPELLHSLTWSCDFGQTSRDSPQHQGCTWSQRVLGAPTATVRSCVHTCCCYCQRLCHCSAAGLGTWELCFASVLMFPKWPFWEFPVCGHFQKSLFPAWFGPKPLIQIKSHFLQTGGLACQAALLLGPHLLWYCDGFLCPNSRGSAVPWPVRLS